MSETLNEELREFTPEDCARHTMNVVIPSEYE